MRPLLTSLAVLSLALSLGCTSPAPQADKPTVPTAASIEQLLRDRLAPIEVISLGPMPLNLLKTILPYPTVPRARLPSLTPYKKMELMAFKLLDLVPVSASRWQAEIEVQFDFGPPPPAVLGFQRLHRLRFHLLVKQRGERLALLRFAPVAGLHPLPTRH